MKKRNLKTLKLKKNVISDISSLNTKGGADTRYREPSGWQLYDHVIHGLYFADPCIA